MPTFPTLSQNPSIEGWDEGIAFDPTIKSRTEGGYKQTRPRFTRMPDGWNIAYKALPQADKNTLRTFEKTVKVGSEMFTWTNPINSVTYNVRFVKPISYKLHLTSIYWNVEFELEEV